MISIRPVSSQIFGLLKFICENLDKQNFVFAEPRIYTEDTVKLESGGQYHTTRLRGGS